jgi:hypothetical protein
LAVAIRVSKSPIPRSLDRNLAGLKYSRSSRCSPVPIKRIGAPVLATALMAPPPLAVPSSFVIITPVIFAALLKASACFPACWPMLASRST